MNDVDCPYCGEPQEINHDDGYGYAEDRLDAAEKKIAQECCHGIRFPHECGDCIAVIKGRLHPETVESRGELMAPSVSAKKERKVISRVFILCNAYESGYGHGLANDGLCNPYSPGGEEHEAYQTGVQAGYEASKRRVSSETGASKP